MTGGRPLRFLALALGGWVVIRIAVLLPEIRAVPAADVIPRLIAALVPDVAATGLAQRHAAPSSGHARTSPRLVIPSPHPQPQPQPPRRLERPPEASVMILAARVAPDRRIDLIPSPCAPPAPLRGTSRLTGSAWLLVRGGPAGTVSGGQLGASQGGMRFTYALGRHRRVALAARIAAPLKGRGREVALGVEWQPLKLPIRVVAEQRLVLDGGRGGPTVGVIAGYGPADIAPGIRIEAYGQGGVIARAGVEGFVDASARVTHRIGKIGDARIDIGIGAWGSAQRAAARFDIGPSVVATLPIARTSLRLTLDWRERLAGDARPGSGPALSIGSDF
jgi:hypothetical protein